MDDRNYAATVLRPTLWIVLALVLVMASRVLGWHLRDAFARPEATVIAADTVIAAVTVIAAGKGMVWDLALYTSLFALARGGTLLRAGAGPTARVIGAAVLLVSTAAACVGMAIRAFDLGHLYLARCHLTGAAFVYLNVDYLPRLFDSGSLFAPFGALAAIVAVGVCAVLDAREIAVRALAVSLAGAAVPRWVIALPLAACIVPVAATVRDQVVHPPHVYSLRVVPEINAISQWFAWQTEPEQPGGEIEVLPVELREKLRRHGLLPRASAVSERWPLLRAELDATPMPHPRRRTAVVQPLAPGSARDLRPNVILTIVESLNSTFVHALSGRYEGLMPEMSALARRLTRVDGFRNTSAPTIAALVTMLCSLHPPTHPRDLRVGETTDGSTAYTCLSDVLRARGYRTVFVQSTSRRATGEEFFLRSHGFDEVLGRDAMRKRWPGAPEGVWGQHDDRLLAFAREQIERLEDGRRNDGRPFMLVAITLDTHEPGMAGPTCALPRDALGRIDVADVPNSAAARKLLAAYHCTDRALGDFGRFVMQPERAARTLWLITADHAAFKTVAAAPLFRAGEGRTFDDVPLLIHDPMHELPKRVRVDSGTADVAPTILHILGLSWIANSMTGHSIFGARPRYPVLLGRVGDRFAMLHVGEIRLEFPMGELRRWCRLGGGPLADWDAPLSACDLQSTLRWHDSLWRAGRLFPSSRYFGAAEVERAQLRREVDLNFAERAAAGLEAVANSAASSATDAKQ